MRPASPDPASSILLRCIAALLFSASVASGLTPRPAAGDTWRRIKPEDLALKQGRVDPEADAEAIDWEIRVSDELDGETIKSSQTQHLLIKIFTSRGREAHGRVDIPYSSGARVIDVAARTIRPDGSVVEVERDAIHERILVKGGGLKVKVRSFAIPALEPGSIVEYRWTIVQDDRVAHNVRVEFQRDIPVEQLRFSIRPLLIPQSSFRLRIRAFNFHMPPFSKDPNGFDTITIPSIPAFKEEPSMPPASSVRPWIAIFYDEEREPPIEEFWEEFGKRMYDASTSFYRSSSDIKNLAKEAVAGAVDQDQKLDRITEYCRARLRNADASDSGLTAKDREWLEKDHPPSEYLKRGLANREGMLRVFLSLANAAGLDARLAAVPDRRESVFDSRIPAHYLLDRTCAAVAVLGAWRAVDPASADVPAGMLPWWMEGVEMFVPDPETPYFVRTPISVPDQSLSQRIARLSLSEDGTMEGEVDEEFTGHQGAEQRQGLRDRSPVERENRLREEIKRRLSTAEISDIRFNPGPTSSQPFHVAYHVRVSGYAQAPGKRLFLQPAFFQRGGAAIFSARERRYPVSFPYPWSENDMVVIKLPPGFRIENLPELKPIVLPNLGMHSVKLSVSEDGGTLQFLHSTRFGESGTISFPVVEYPRLKEAFSQFQAQDDTVVSLVANEPTPR